jgi:hypothetical protein
MGWTIGTLRVRCSQLKISLRRRRTKIALPQAILDQLHQRAALIGISAAELAADLLKQIARDNLYNAVLDRDTEVTCATPRATDHQVYHSASRA